MDKNICNNTVGIVTDINLENLEVRVAFSVIGGIVNIGIKKESVTFQIDRKPAKVSLSLDNQMFFTGQAYVALS
ncbi:hypothetical protein RhiirA4_450539 [Rhizophagus irregularis]|uniref:Uncharacterized protein n=1 Tax=Rhizophagus irregularis TaxID=588596 RepID=A0A2I1FTF4_9GLOM|nr:hypothetical protein RhiirA4_450539 [Rhizophagus irregularis]